MKKHYLRFSIVDAVDESLILLVVRWCLTVGVSLVAKNSFVVQSMKVPWTLSLLMVKEKHLLWRIGLVVGMWMRASM